MRYLMMALLSISLLSCTQPTAAQKKVAIIGSSTSACYVVGNTPDCYVNKLIAFYNTQAPSDTSFDNGFAVGGYNPFRGMPTSYVSPYSDPAFQPDPAHNITAALATNPDVVIVNYPTNGFDVLPLDSIMYCFRTIRDSANKKGIPCFVSTSQPRLSPASFNTAAIKRKLADIKDSILLQFGSFALDFYTGMINPADSNLAPAYNSGDDIHFNAAGHTVLAQRVEAANIFNATALPATFLQYNASYNGNSVLVAWSTAKEIDVAHYDIMRSGDGKAFAKLGELDPNNGSGTYHYQYTDKEPLKGWNYYKVIIVDRDGKKQPSPVFKVLNNAGKLAIRKVITQPVQIVLELQNNETQNLGLQVLSSTGLLIRKSMQRIDNGNSTLTINTASLSSGIYYIKLATATGETLITSFFKN